MAEALLNQVLNDATDVENVLEWLGDLQDQDAKFAEYRCSRTEFVTFLLNFIHEEVGNFPDKRTDPEDSPSSADINRSHSFPQDLSCELDPSAQSSTPKIVKISSDSSVASYMSPISPIYKPNNSFTTPKCQKSLCLGDFIINKRSSSRKKSDTKKRIKPTNLAQHKSNGFHKSENSFNFNKSDSDFSTERNVLMEERLKILSRSDILNVGAAKKLPRLCSDELVPNPNAVRYRGQLDKVVQIYVALLNSGFIVNLTSEIHFLVSLLLKRQQYDADWGVEVLAERLTAAALFGDVHAVVHFAAQVLQTQAGVLQNYDNSTLRLLTDNERLTRFAPGLVQSLRAVHKPDRTVESEARQPNVCFNSDTDNRQNFPNDPSFHAFRKQRDLFYEVLRVWEQQRLAPGFSFGASLGGKIKTLLSLSGEPTNFVHFSRLFKAQLLRNGGDVDFATSLDVDAQKLSRLRSRCVTREANSLPEFGESEEFYRDFILVGANCCFNRHLADALVQEIGELNETNFNTNEVEEGDVDLGTRKLFCSCVKSLRILAKFLAFIETLPYKTDSSYSDNLLETHLRIRKQIRPNFDIKHHLDASIRRKSLILCIPWLIKYLSMLDYVTLRLPYYKSVHKHLFWVYRHFDWGPHANACLIKFSLGWLFEVPHFPDCFTVSSDIRLDFEHEPVRTGLDHFHVVDQNILYFCCPYLDEIKKLLTSTSTAHSVTIKHITPVTASQSPDQIAKKKLEQQLEEAFFNGQPISLRKTVEFVSERVASTCVKYVCSTLVPNHKKQALEKLKTILVVNREEDLDVQKVALQSKAAQLSVACLKELQKACDKEIEAISAPKIRQAIEALVSVDILPQIVDVCAGVTKKSCLERVRQWVDSHVTLGVFTKDFMDQVHKSVHLESRKAKKPVFMLPPTGTNPNHNDRCTSGAHLYEKYRDLTISLIENKQTEPLKCFVALLDDTVDSFNGRGDINQCILASICGQLVDLCLLLLAHEPEVLQDGVMTKATDIWRLYHNGCDDLFRSLLCPRNVKIFAQSNDCKASWKAFSKFCAYLMQNKLLSCDSFEAQCAGIFRIDWDQETLQLITGFLKSFLNICRNQGGSASDFTFIDFLSEYCDDLC